MRSPVSKRASDFVETEVFRRVKGAVEAGETPILVLGPGGFGKTRLLTALSEDWASSGGTTVFISLRDVGRGEDVYLLIRRALAEHSPPSRRGEAGLIAGTGRAGLRATVEFIASASPNLLLLLDGLDEMPDPSPVFELLDLISNSLQAKIVVASRDTFSTSRRSRLFRSVFGLSSFTTEEVSEFIRKSGGPTLDRAEIDLITRN
jgi:hypothetical protein